MEGYTLIRMLREILQETSTGTFMNDRTSYDYLYAAVLDFNKRTYYSTATQEITTVPSTQEYNLNPDFVAMALIDDYNMPYIKFTVNGTDYFITETGFAQTILQNDKSTSDVASGFYVTDAGDITNMTGEASIAGNNVNGESVLTDSSGDFTNAAVGDYVHNTADGSHGVIISKTSSTQITCCLFEGTNNDWTVDDPYIIVPQARYKIGFQPIPSGLATAEITYVKAPTPVYSPYKAYRLPQGAALAVVKFAAFLYKYRDREPGYGDALFKYYDAFTRKVAAELRRGRPERSGYRVNLSKMNKRSTGAWG